jgi:hypothetical protein
MAARASSQPETPVAPTPEQNAALFAQFLEWQKDSSAKPEHPRVSARRHKSHRKKLAKVRHCDDQPIQTDAFGLKHAEATPAKQAGCANRDDDTAAADPSQPAGER